MKNIWKKISVLLVLTTVFFFFSISSDAEKPLIIVIDPGHGGDNLGAEYESYTEKEMTMIVAKAMKEELEKYEQVVVYLTHDMDVNMSIEQRALFAKEKNADFLFCLHFNMSVNHDLFGAEVWVPAGGEFYSKGYSFAQIEMSELTGLGLYSRGIKTKLNDRGDNYYGILRYCSEQQIPSALIEHCHLDHAKDQDFYQQGEEQLKEFGRLDATAAAKYFRLCSTTLGVDYSNYPVEEVPAPEGMVRPDKTEPELCRIEVTDINRETGEVTVSMEAEDSDSYILYYNYSLDGGNTYSMPDAWPRALAWNQSDKDHSFTVCAPFDQPITLRCKASNGFDVWAESNEIILDPIEDPERLRAEREREREEKERLKTALRREEIDLAKLEAGQESNTSFTEVLIITALILFILACIIFVSFFMAKMIYLLVRGNRKR